MQEECVKYWDLEVWDLGPNGLYLFVISLHIFHKIAFCYSQFGAVTRIGLLELNFQSCSNYQYAAETESFVR